MKQELNFKFIRWVDSNRKPQGFTLIELLVVVIIIGILTAIALPSLLNQTVKARQAEAKNTIGAVNSGQTAFRAFNQSFAKSMNDLALGLPSITANYTYTITSEDNIGQVSALANDSALKSYSGATEKYNDIRGEIILSSVMCETGSPGVAPSLPGPGGPPACPAAMLTLGR